MKTGNLGRKFLLALIAPLLLVLGGEGLLRALHFGLPASFLLETDIQGQPALVDNPFYGYRFFAPELARNPAPISIARAKPQGVVRVAVLGESAAQGDPMLEYGLPRMLEKMLNAAAPTGRYEVVNAAMTAINSHVIIDIARDLAQAQPDVVVIYMGNNEVVGPYGPGTVFTAAHNNHRLTPLRVRLTGWRMAQSFRSLAGLVQRGGTEPRQWDGLNMFSQNRVAEDDPRLETMRDAFENNLAKIILVVQEQGARVILSTVAVNLNACPPFESAPPSQLPADTRTRWEQTYQAGHDAWTNARWEEARDAFKRATEIHPNHADSCYRLAESLAALDEGSRAEEWYERALSLDQLRVRADRGINDRITRTADRLGVEQIDAAQLFTRLRTESGKPDSERFLDHVHFTFSGTWQLSQALAVRILGSRTATLPDLPETKRLMFYTSWSEMQQASVMLERVARPPFVHKSDREKNRRRFEEQLQRASEEAARTDIDTVAAEYRQQAAQAPDDFFLPFQWGQILGEHNRWSEALPLMTQTLARLPLHFETRLLPVLALARLGRSDEAARTLVGRGPPFGLYLSEYALQTLNTLQTSGYPREAAQFKAALLEQAQRFPRRAAVSAWEPMDPRAHGVSGP